MSTVDEPMATNSEQDPSTISTAQLLDTTIKTAVHDPTILSLCICVQHAPEIDPETGRSFHRVINLLKTDPGVNMDRYVEDLAKTILTRLMTADPGYALKFLEQTVIQFFDRMYAQLKNPTKEEQENFQRAIIAVHTKIAENAFANLNFQFLLQSYCAQLPALREDNPNIGETESERMLDTMNNTYSSPNYTTYRDLIIRLVSDLSDTDRVAVLNYVSENAYKYDVDNMDFEKFEEELKSVISSL